MAVLVVSWDGYSDVWETFFNRFFNYWPDCPYPVFLGSNFLKYPDSRVSTLPIGTERDYSSNLIAMVGQIDQEWIILWIEDFIPSAPISTARIRKIIDLAQLEKIGYVNLLSLPMELYRLFVKHDLGEEIGEVPKGVPYRVALGVVLWNKQTLIKVLLPGESAWEIERRGSLRSWGFEDKFYSVSKRKLNEPPVFVVNAIEGGKWTKKAEKFFLQEGLQDHLRTRAIQTYRSHMYIKLYSCIRYFTIKVLYSVGGDGFMRWLTRLISRRMLAVQN